jgi:Transposase DDE domain/Domain of unknown function (DUF4372)
MKKTTTPTRSKNSCLKQICQLIPSHLVSKLARKHKVQSRTFSPWSHVVSMLYAHLTRAIGLNDVCDGLRLHRGWLSGIRGATPPSRNGMSHANKKRSAKIAEDLYWAVSQHLHALSSSFGGRNYKGMPRRFKRVIHAVDSSTIKLVANCMDWAKHRRRKAAAKLHLRLNLQSFLPTFAIVNKAKESDARKAWEVCAGLKAGEIVVFDKAYVDFAHLHALEERGVFWVNRAKEGMKFRCVKRRIKKPEGNILRDDEILLTHSKSRSSYPARLRRVVALVEIKAKLVEMTFITNNMEWAASSICDLYKSRWGIEAFFKQIKQVLQLNAFLGHSRNAIQWQVWTALLVYLLLRYLAFLSRWNHSFTRIFTIVRSVLWSRFYLMELLRFYGTAGGDFRLIYTPKQAFLPGFGP